MLHSVYVFYKLNAILIVGRYPFNQGNYGVYVLYSYVFYHF